MLKDSKHKRNEKGIAILAKNIKKYRKERKLTIQGLALELGVDYSQISRMERGIVNPSVSIIFNIADFLQIKASQLLEE